MKKQQVDPKQVIKTNPLGLSDPQEPKKASRWFDVICTLGTILGGAFFYGKCMGLIDWSWWWVLSPILALIVIVVAVVVFVNWAIGKDA